MPNKIQADTLYVDKNGHLRMVECPNEYNYFDPTVIGVRTSKWLIKFTSI